MAKSKIDALLTVRLNERALKQILINLISNAGEFTPVGETHIKILPELSKNGGVQLSVRDTGIGTPKDMLGEVMQPFKLLEAPFTLQYRGSGLSLAIVASLAEHFCGGFSSRE